MESCGSFDSTMKSHAAGEGQAAFGETEMTRNGLGLAVAAVCGAMSLGASNANADQYRRSSGYSRPVYYAPSHYRPVYSAPVVYSRPVVYAPPVTYVEPVSYYRPVTYVERPVYYPPVRVVRPVYAPVVSYSHYGHHRTYGGYVGDGGFGFSYGSRHRGFSFSFGD